jgi:hypothetical protein
MKRMMKMTAITLLTMMGCADTATGPTADRSIYKMQAYLYASDIRNLVNACLEGGEAPVLFSVKSLTAPQPSGVDMRVEVAAFVTEEMASCVEEYLKDHGAVEIGESGSSGDGGGSSSDSSDSSG